ncbi:MarR family transcriptional regulator [Actinocrinis puniceicyclus]|uniref:MarR family transcriptional regulator n=1 Tax=Actinocrinis puniceicyclus TaxID=977794 RepID=A0A8J7WVQ8_9ACTN|nr:MarR family transcriptional regulator [Actinocrinis puniceicyclus]MBS2966720.1 MarR family transcriptional regulator [Actinocrinis puniceicyclus]
MGAAGARDPGAVRGEPVIATAADAANEPRVVAFGRLLGAAGGLEYLLGRAIEREFGISHAMFEVLLLLGRAAAPLPMREISQARVLTTGGVTRLVDRMQAAGLVRREVSPRDGRVHLVALTELGESIAVRAARVHASNVQRYMLDALPERDRETVMAGLAVLSRSARAALPQMP